MVDVYYTNLICEDERNSINFYAQEIGFFVDLKKRVESDTLKQWCDFFISYSEQEMENANDRLKKFRELADCELRQAELRRV
jgi:Trp operon repressor